MQKEKELVYEENNYSNDSVRGDRNWALEGPEEKGHADERRHADEDGRNEGWRDDDGQDERDAWKNGRNAQGNGRHDEGPGDDERRRNKGDGKDDGWDVGDDRGYGADDGRR